MKAIASLFLAAVAAYGAPADERPIQTAKDVDIVFESLDRNDDRRISKTEAAKQRTLKRRFAGVDANSDGYLSRAEFEARPSPERFE